MMDLGDRLFSSASSHRIQSGAVSNINIGKGTVDVLTDDGKRLTEVRVLSPNVGPVGQNAAYLPVPKSPCLVVTTKSQAEKEHILIGTYPLYNRADGRSAGRRAADLLPGEYKYSMDNGGYVNYKPNGTIDIAPHPYLRTMYLPQYHMYREFFKKWERIGEPQNFIRQINSHEEEASLFEFFFNERSVFRPSDETAPVIWTLGDNSISDASEENPQEEWLHYYKVEKRPPSSSSPLGIYEERVGHQQGVVVNKVTQEKNTNTVVKEKQGNKDGVVQELLIEKEEEQKFLIQIKDTGEIVLQNPTWNIFIREDNTLLFESEETSIEVDGKDISVGAGTNEPMALGDQLTSVLNSMLSFMETHTHPSPVGPTGPPIEAPQILPIKNNDVPKIISTDNNVSRGQNW
mgnify:CR=1 FL=1